jgi:hypothetical protein
MAGPNTQIFEKCLKSIPDSSGTDPGTTEQAAEDVDDRQDDNVQVQAVTLLILHKQEAYTQEEQESKEHHATTGIP